MPDLSAAQLIIGFLLLLTPVVFFHELGHYWVARRAGVVVEVFSIGFGPEIYGWTS
ncbi:MAG: site-2 protease family protein, partial [Candidatus Puniceispirillaceae bacterium]